jgi:hypothetical protein
MTTPGKRFGRTYADRLQVDETPAKEKKSPDGISESLHGRSVGAVREVSRTGEDPSAGKKLLHEGSLWKPHPLD